MRRLARLVGVPSLVALLGASVVACGGHAVSTAEGFTPGGTYLATLYALPPDPGPISTLTPVPPALPTPSPRPTTKIKTKKPSGATTMAPRASQSSPALECTPGYDPCLPPSSDYDCNGGGGNGPSFADRVIVTGPDIYELDRDGDGVGCDLG